MIDAPACQRIIGQCLNVCQTATLKIFCNLCLGIVSANNDPLLSVAMIYLKASRLAKLKSLWVRNAITSAPFFNKKTVKQGYRNGPQCVCEFVRARASRNILC